MEHNPLIRRDIHLVAHGARRIQRLRRRVVDVIDHGDRCGPILFDDQRRFVLAKVGTAQNSTGSKADIRRIRAFVTKTATVSQRYRYWHRRS